MTIIDFFKGDRYAALSGIELLSVEPGRAKGKMEICEKHLNTINTVQGGAIFTLADLTFAAAVNAYGNIAVSIETSIRYFKAVGKGVLYADAKLVHLHKRLATFEVRITNETDDLIAFFTATAYRKDIPLMFSDDAEN
jgi:acyl-CoA thioesterase